MRKKPRGNIIVCKRPLASPGTLSPQLADMLLRQTRASMTGRRRTTQRKRHIRAKISKKNQKTSLHQTNTASSGLLRCTEQTCTAAKNRALLIRSCTTRYPSKNQLPLATSSRNNARKCEGCFNFATTKLLVDRLTRRNGVAGLKTRGVPY